MTTVVLTDKKTNNDENKIFDREIDILAGIFVCMLTDGDGKGRSYRVGRTENEIFLLGRNLHVYRQSKLKFVRRACVNLPASLF